MTYRELFDEAIGDAPVSTVDVDRVIGRQRRVGRLRTWGAAGAGAAAVLAVTLAATVLPGPAPSPVPPGADGKITTVAGTPEDASRLDAAAVAALTREVPGLTWPESTTPDLKRSTRTNTLELYGASAQIGVGAGRARLNLSVERLGAELFGRSACLPERPPMLLHYECVERPGPAGARLRTTEMIHIQNRAKDKKGDSFRFVNLLRPDGSVVNLTLYQTVGEGPMPMTIAQLVAVASDPTITLGPLPPGVTVTPRADPRPTEVRGPVAQQIDKAVFAALRAQAPGVAVGDRTLEQAWTGGGGENDADNYWGQAPITVGKAGGAVFSVQIMREAPSFGRNLTCGRPTKTYRCTAGQGPDGERYRMVTNTGGSPERNIVVIRADGSWLDVNHSGSGVGGFALTAEQQKAIALDPTIALPAK